MTLEIDKPKEPQPNRGHRGMGTHQSAKMLKDEWLTPPEIVNALGPFDLDPCAPVVRPWPTAKHHFTTEDNGLIKEWHGRVWLNPPYGPQTGQWQARMVEHRSGIELIFARTETADWHRYIWAKAMAIHFFEGRLFFHHVDGTRAKHNAGAPSALVAYTHFDSSKLKNSGLPGRYVPLY